MGLLSQSERRRWTLVSRSLADRLAEERSRVQRLDHELTHHPGSGLPNGAAFHRRPVEEGPWSLVVLSLGERLGVLKRSFAPDLVAWLLFQTAQRLKKAAGPGVGVFHPHDEVFWIEVPGAPEAAVLALADRLTAEAERSHSLQGKSLSFSVRTGVALGAGQGTPRPEVVRQAEIALAEAERTGQKSLAFTSELQVRMVRDLELHNDMLRALEGQTGPDQSPQFELWFQPQIEVRGWGTPAAQGRIVGAEALVRWNHPSRGLVPPGQFIPMAEETGLVVPLGQWVLHAALQTLTDLQGRGLDRLTLSLNVAMAQFARDGGAAEIASTVLRRGLNPAKLKIEITESGLVGPDQDPVRITQALREAGFAILVDDFGTGYSNLSRLQALPVDVLKVDKSFVDGVVHRAGDQALARTIVDLARALNLGIIVEGTEHRAQVDWFHRQGATIFQGYYFSPPLPYQRFLAYVRDFPKIFHNLARVGG